MTQLVELELTPPEGETFTAEGGADELAGETVIVDLFCPRLATTLRGWASRGMPLSSMF